MQCTTPPIGAHIYQNFIHLAIQGAVVPQWAVGATIWATSRSLQFWTFCVKNQPTLRQWHVYLTIQCVMCPQWALGATILRYHVHPVTLSALVLQWVLGATMWTTSRWIDFQMVYVPNEPWKPVSMSYTSSRSMHYVSPLSPRSYQASTLFTFSYFGRSRSPVSHRSHYINHVKIYPFSDIIVPNEPWEPIHINVIYI